ncbi:2-deoxystreptamine glucosyltransferase [Planctomycetes bacterium CA13]|uniref:2-deoxystreptamine glucosyltransferase n=1 Tax=Novipirellula herctigrandis TaxID=2527986 RepID=A0A5C5Z3P2_9BACT|nr:2-deoxystreptamine glucosyltransferase [Planctomycetes bacterium CA13]
MCGCFSIAPSHFDSHSTDSQIPPPYKIHVALLVVRYDVGGMERYVAKVANGLDREFFHVSLICLDRVGNAKSWISKTDVEIVELGIRSGNSWRAVKAIAGALKRLEPDIVHSHNWGTLLETYLAVKRYGKAVHVHGERGSVLGSDRCSPIKRRMRAMVMRWICRRITVTTNSHCVAKKVCSIVGIDSSAVHIIPNGLERKFPPQELARFREEVRLQFGMSEGSYVIGIVARLSRVKNLGLVIHAFNELPEEMQRATHLLMVGDGPCRSELETLVEQLDLRDRVHFAGHQSNTWRFMAAMDVFVNCSDSEGMSQSMLEAMAAGLPIIATDVGDAARTLLTPNPGGIVIAPNDCCSLTDALVKMSTTEVRRAYAAAALACQGERYGLDTMIRGYEKLYHELASSSLKS